MFKPEISDHLHIPSGINFECTGCGACCQNWPIPVHSHDAARIKGLMPDASDDQLFRPVSGDRNEATIYSYVTQMRADGRCIFLSTENLCELHLQFGAQSKPTMCQIFPFIFLPTPSGVYTSVSFASTGVLLNHGSALVDQRQLIEARWALYCQLIQSLDMPIWSEPQLVPGCALPWTQYLSIEVELLQLFSASDEIDKTLIDACEIGCQHLNAFMPNKIYSAQSIGLDDEIIDWLLIEVLLDFYFQPGDSEISEPDLSGILQKIKVLADSTDPKDTLELATLKERSDCCKNFQINSLQPDVEALLKRFIYCRIFGKTYFGFGYSNLSLMAGFSNLVCIILIFRIGVKLEQVDSHSPVATLEKASDYLKSLERNHPIIELSPRSVAVLEYLFRDPQRIGRILKFAR